MATKQIIRIEITWDGYSKLKLNALVAWLASHQGLTIKRISVNEPKK